MQCLLIDTNQTIEDLNALCVAMQNTHIVLARTHRGLMPIAGANVYVFPYAPPGRPLLVRLAPLPAPHRLPRPGITAGGAFS